MRRHYRAFTLVELLVSVSVLTLLVLVFASLLNSTTAVTTLASKRMDADSSVRPVFDRMAADFSLIVRRNDVSYFLKSSGTTAAMVGNDALAFYSATTGYFPTTPSPVSLVAYRINSDSSNLRAYNRLERMGKGLDWNGASAADKPVLFLPYAIDDPALWPSVTSGSAYDSTDPNDTTYEIIGSQVFRLEYYFIEKATGLFVEHPATWISSSTVKMGDVSAVVVAIAVIDPQSQAMLSNAQIAAIAASLPDYNASMGGGGLLTNWQSVLDSTSSVPRRAIAGVRLYEQFIPLNR